MTAGLLAHPEWALPALAALAVAATLVGVAGWRVRARARRLLGVRGEALAARARRRDAALLAALGLLALALVAPRLGERSEITTASGIDLVVLVDASRSMDAQDVPPSRLRRARRIAEDVIARLAPGDRAALAAFGDQGALLTPLTPDAEALLELLPGLDTELFRWRASRLGDGLAAAARAFDAESPRPRVVLLLGDGEDPGGEEALDAVTTALAAERVRIVAVALGTTEGALVPDGDVALRDRAGSEVVSRANPARLRRLAQATDGELLPTDRFGAVDAEAALVRLRRDAGAAPGLRVERRVPAARVAPFAALAFVLLLAEAWPTRRADPMRARARRASGLVARPPPALAALATGLVLLLPTRLGADELARAEAETAALESEALARPADAALLLELGLARARAERHDDASRAFLAAAVSTRDADLAATAYYDLGVSALARGDLVGARDAFFDALALAPDDREARFNLEWTLRALAERPPQPRKPETGAKPPEPNGTGGAGEAPGARDRNPPESAPGSPGSQQSPDADGHRRPGSADAGESKQPDADAAGRETERSPERAPRALSAERARRLLEGVADAPGLALRQVTREDATDERLREPRGPVW